MEKEMDLKEFGRRLRTLRLERGMKQKGLGESIGISEAMISHFEAGNRFPRLDQLLQLCDVLRVEAKYFLLESKYKHSTKNMEAVLDLLVEKGVIDNKEEPDAETLEELKEIVKAFKKANVTFNKKSQQEA